MKSIIVFLVIFNICVKYTQSTYIHGVPLSKQSEYTGDLDEPKQFTCKDGSLTIPFSQINDNYCDCQDGSDEPGTSACLDNQFYCINKGFLGRYIKSSYVNDGVCDCCDGSDEYLNNEIKCKNTCEELYHDYLTKKIEEEEILRQSSELKKEYYEKGKEKYERIKEEIDSMKSEVESKQKELNELKEIKEKEEKVELEEKERRINEFKIEEKREDLYNKLDINSLSVEQLKQIIYNITIQYRCQEEIIKMSHQLQNKENEAINEIDMSQYDPPSDYSSEEANNARNKYNEKKDEVKELLDNYNNKIKEMEVIKENQDDYAILGIVDECISEDIDKYKYEICFMKTVKQDSLLMGNFDHRENNTFYYLHGEKCWNGPERSVKVEVICGMENRIVNVVEPSTCVYEMKFETPVICKGYSKQLNFDPLSVDEYDGEL